MSRDMMPNDHGVFPCGCSLWNVNGLRGLSPCPLHGAAPEMLQALQDTLKMLEDMTSAEYQTGADKPMREEIRALIQRATK